LLGYFSSRIFWR